MLRECFQSGQQEPVGQRGRCLRLQLFIRGDSTVCRAAVQYAEAFVSAAKGFAWKSPISARTRNSLEEYWQLTRRFRVEKPLVPAFYACDQLRIGFDAEASTAARVEELFTIHAYVRLTCQHCRDARRFLTGLAERWKGIRIVYHDVEHEPDAMEEMTQLARKYGVVVPSFPTILVCGHLISGYRTDATTGRQIEELLWRSSIANRTGQAILDRPQQQLDKNSAIHSRPPCGKVRWLP